MDGTRADGSKKPARRLRQALEASEGRFRALIEQNADGILVLDPVGVVRFCNPAAEVLLGRSRAELIGSD